MIQLKNICKTYRAGPNQFQALHGIDLTIEKEASSFQSAVRPAPAKQRC